jgi:hypothetical protein
MTTREDLRVECAYRLGDISQAIFTTTELNKYIDKAIKSLYPTYFQYEVATTTATDGPLQTMPTGARDLYYIGVQKPNSTRVRLLRQWREGQGEAFIPKTGISGETLVWAWTQGFTVPTEDLIAIDLNEETEEVVILRVCISALERISSSRVEIAKYFAMTVREGVTEADIISILDAYHASLDARIKQAVPRPVRVG